METSVEVIGGKGKWNLYRKVSLSGRVYDLPIVHYHSKKDALHGAKLWESLPYELKGLLFIDGAGFPPATPERN